MSIEYRNGELFVEDVAVSLIAQEVGSPFYCYCSSMIRQAYKEFADSLRDQEHLICYAMKANSNLSVLKMFKELGAGADVVSQGEIARALEVGICADKIIFAGVGKTSQEIEYALSNEIVNFSVESQAELLMIDKVAARLGKKARISVRVNPDVDAGSHDKITTGRKGDKFGIDIDKACGVYDMARGLTGVDAVGVAAHIGSQITSLEPFEKAFLRVKKLVADLRQGGHDIRQLDLGGGLGISYSGEKLPSIAQYCTMVKNVVSDMGVKLIVAPGRSLVGNAGILVTRVIYVKETSHKDFVVVDGAMNDLMRPGLYDAYHEIIPVIANDGSNNDNGDNKSRKDSGRNVRKFEIVGPVCETTDVIGKSRNMAEPAEGDLLAIYSAGAYGSVMSNQYNSRPLIPEVLVDGSEYKIVRRRPGYDEMWDLERV